MMLRITNKLFNIKQHNVEVLSVLHSLMGKEFCTSTKNAEESDLKSQKINSAMKMYLENAKKYDEFIKKERVEFEKGKRHLANMMGVKYEQMTQNNIDKAIEYLFPSGLYDKSARPTMKPPEDVFPAQKEAQFDMSGRPFDSMFYTVKPNFNKLIYNIVEEIEKVDKIQHKLHIFGSQPTEADCMQLKGSSWISKERLEDMLHEIIRDQEYDYFLQVFERLVNHPCSNHAKEFIATYRTPLDSLQKFVIPLPIQVDKDGRQFVYLDNCLQKSCRGTVKLIANGSGKITINGHEGIDYFRDFQPREQILFPFVFTNTVGEFDVEATVVNGGPTGQSGTIRWGIANALKSFVDPKTIEEMRIAGLLTKNHRRRERKKFGQEGARRKFTWKKR